MRRFLPLAMLAAMAVGPPPVGAMDFEWGSVTPSLSYTGEYDDNVLRLKSNTKSDYINTISSGIAGQLRLRGSDQFSLGYSNQILRYVDRTKLDAERHFGNFQASLAFTKLSLFAREQFAHTDDFPTSELTTRVERNENEAAVGSDWDAFGRWGVGGTLTHFHANFLKREFDILDRTSVEIGPHVYYLLTPKLRAFVEYNYVDETFDSAAGSNNIRHRGLVGLRGDITDRLTSTAKMGYERTSFERRGGPDLDNFVISSETTFQPLQRLGFRLLLNRSVRASSFSNNPQFESFDGLLTANYAFRPRIFFLPRVAVGVDDFPEKASNNGRLETRSDVRYGYGFTIRYQMQRWLHLDANYDFTRRTSNFDQFDYADNRIWASIGASF